MKVMIGFLKKSWKNSKIFVRRKLIDMLHIRKYFFIIDYSLNKILLLRSNDFYNDDDDDHVPYAVERIVERRYYVKKSRLGSKRDQLTSTSDLTVYGRKNRQYSGVSSVTTATTICSQCSTSTPTYIENLRDQSDTLRNEINGLKNEIEQLQTSQQEFFQQLRTHFQSKPDATITPLNFGRSQFCFLLFL